ncbi:MAG: CHASE2 domain-containing protein [Oscillatoria sp. SIO1A7]|nr:CHASE2 domain-containing protein [Oscillatoria sp. SIO1A7]
MAGTIAGSVIAAENAGLFQLLEWATLDQFFRWRAQEPPDPRIAIVTINESDIAKLGKWPIPDGVLAQLILNLKAHNPRVIGLDLYRDLPVEPGHDDLIRVFKSTPNLIGIEKAIGNTVPPSPTLKSLEQVAMADVLLDADGKVRRGLISVKSKDGNNQLSLGARVALMYLEAEGITPEIINIRKIRLGRAMFVPFTGNDGGYARSNAGGYQIILNFRGLLDRFYSISMSEVLENQIQPELIRDRVVLIGATAESLNDFFYTSHSTRLIGSPKRTPGVAIHANLTSQMLSGALEGRPLIRVWSEPLEWLWTLAWSFLGASTTCLLVKTKAVSKTISSQTTATAILILFLGSVPVATSYLAFLFGWWLPVVSPALALTGSGMALSIYYSLSKERHSPAQLQSNLPSLAQFLEALPVAIAVFDASGQLYFINHKGKALLRREIPPGTTPEHIAAVYQLYIAGTDRLYPSEDLPVLRALQGEYATTDNIEIHYGDKTIATEVWAAPIYDELGNITHAIVAFQDKADLGWAVKDSFERAG